MTKKLKKLPIGIQTFQELREDAYLYVDKTKEIHSLIQEGKAYFISRPRRFGKSLLISTLEQIYKGNKELFKNLYIYNTDYKWTKHPVIRLDFSSFNKRSREELEQSLRDKLAKIAEDYQLKPIDENKLTTDYFKTLIQELSKINQVVVLIDEYDSPLITHMGKNNELAIEMREFLKEFYAILKSEDEYLKFVLLTGVSKFSKAGVFSGLNQLNDITMDTKYCNLVGWTQEELEKNFLEYIEDLALIQKLTKKEIIEKIKYWYNGYQFSSNGEKRVYNPFSTLLLFLKKEFKFHWFESGTPSFLIQLMKEKNYNISKLENMEVGETAFSAYEIENLNPLALLFQTGYLTIKETYQDEEIIYKLSYPNYEVKKAFLDNLTRNYSGSNIEVNYINTAIRALGENDLELFFQNLRVFFANIPYDIHLKKEAYYQTIFYCIFSLIGLKIHAEIKTNIGRIDAVVEIDNNVYIFEFKLNASKEEALAQIEEKKYFESFLNKNKNIYLVGVEFRFDEQERNIGEWVMEEFNNGE